MANKIATKGMALAQTVGTAYVPIVQLLSIGHSGSGAHTFNSTTLDGGVFETFGVTGYSAPGEIDFEFFYDPALVGHQNITDVIGTPAFANWKISYSDSATTTQIASAIPSSFGMNAALGEGLKGSGKLTVSGDPGWPT